MLVLVMVKAEVVEEVGVRSAASLGQRGCVLGARSVVDARMSDDDVRFYMGAQCRALRGHERDTWLLYCSSSDRAQLLLTLLQSVRGNARYIMGILNIHNAFFRLCNIIWNELTPIG